MFGSGNQSAASFASLANNTSGGSGFLNQTSSNAGIFSTNNKQSFLSNAATKVSAKKPTNADGEEDADETAPEEFAPDDSQFKRPDIVLPDLVEVKTGEENEVCLSLEFIYHVLKVNTSVPFLYVKVKDRCISSLNPKKYLFLL